MGAFETGVTAATIMFKHLDKKRSLLVNDNIVLKSTLIVRESSTERKL